MISPRFSIKGYLATSAADIATTPQQSLESIDTPKEKTTPIVVRHTGHYTQQISAARTLPGETRILPPPYYAKAKARPGRYFEIGRQSLSELAAGTSDKAIATAFLLSDSSA